MIRKMSTQNTVSSIIKIVFLCLVVCKVSNAEYFSSADKMRALGDIELELKHNFLQYLEWQEKELRNYRKFIEQVKLQHKVAMEDIEDYLGNPINVFTLIKRMVIDWNQLHDFVKEREVHKQFQKDMEAQKLKTTFPDVNDLRGAVKGLARLQKVYNLNTSDLAIGDIAGVYQSFILTWHECYEIATNLFDENEYELAVEWFEQTLKKLQSAEDDPAQLKFLLDTHEYIALAQYELGEVDLAISYIDAILDFVPNHLAKDTKMYMARNLPSQFHLIEPSTDAASAYIWSSNYTRLCRGIQLPEKVHHSLRCTLETNNNPVLYLAPLKVEQLSFDPEIILFHGLLTDNQINSILELAQGQMRRSEVRVGRSGSVTSDVRVCQQSKVDYINTTMQQVLRLTSVVSNLDMGNPEIMQIANYGLGGQFEPHHDFLGIDQVHESFTDNRIATHMFYLSDVELGGYTVFPMVNLYLKPVKGAMVRWWNLHKSLDGDYRTLHAGCPVILGSKRIGNVWAHSGMQEFRRPCGLVNDKHTSVAFNFF